jgi:hypothetical protein
MLYWLGIELSYSRPRVSDDNAFAEALLRTAKYRPEFPTKGFADLEAAREWSARFVQWYNHEHRHSGIRYVTPAQRHVGQDGPVLAACHAVYQDARQRNPQRWSGPTRNWTPVGAVTLNPERDAVVRAATSQIQLSGSIGEPAFPSRPKQTFTGRPTEGMLAGADGGPPRWRSAQFIRCPTERNLLRSRQRSHGPRLWHVADRRAFLGGLCRGTTL